jgi:hypothetical protein
MIGYGKRFRGIQFVLVFLILTGCESKPGCDAFRVGNFYHPLPNGDSVFIQRDDTSQIEVRPGYTARFSIGWLDNCEYEMRMTNMAENGKNVPIPDSFRSIKNRVKIIETSTKYYVFDAKRSDGLEFADTLWIGREVIGGFSSVP